MTLDDLKNIDFNNLGSWPVPIKIGSILVICIVILFAGFWFLIQGELDEYAGAQKKEEGLRETYMNKKGLAINLPAYQQQMDEMEQTFGSLLRQLPNTTEVPDLLVDITQAGLGRGLEFTLFRPEKELPKDFYAEMPISVQVRGSYHELAQFVSDVAALPRIVTFGDINISSSGKDNKLTMSAKARTYRYLEEGGVAKPVKAKPRGRK
ncbi:MAG: type 4a pilus biogenesis protein PilO [Sulfuricaulis sp.]|uniref:type 4a pilus biogenesis protein PilO n=1 Tax=Sulfuricaulis sp. TaxID=2003553 RepID=UPI0025CD2689|nr:type 4a pilus biogenesis protein PilO [Sulfuricaulis sp.]MCR4346267.1 type 4a pilus biogenesis protein PilO [Sulfuricaulis sp.]